MTKSFPAIDAAAVAQMSEALPFVRALGAEVVSVTPGVGKMKLAWREDLVGDPRSGLLHGGAHQFDVERENARKNIAFGYGVHMCIGAALARKELNVAFRVILERMDNFELACAEDELYYPPNVLLRGMSKLPLRFTSRV